MMQWGRFFRDRFDLLFVTSLFLFLFWRWSLTHDPDIKDFVVGLFGALLATVNASLRRNNGSASIDASTSTGDIKVEQPVVDKEKET